MTATKEITKAEQFRQHYAENKREIVECIPPSGLVYTFEKPSKFKMLFHAGQLPQVAASSAVESWRQKGLIPDEVEVSDEQANNIILAQKAFELRDAVLKLSVEPKLVAGEALHPGELSTDDVADDDLDYIFRWVSAGGDESLMLSTFPTGPRSDPLASARRKKQRHKSQSNGGAK